MSRWYLGSLLVFVVAGTAAAQPVMGDLIICDQTSKHIAYIDRNLKVIQSITTPLPQTPIGLQMATNNSDMICMGGNEVWTITTGGQVQTLALTGTGGNTGGDLLQDGTYGICASVWGTAGYVKVLDPVTKSVTTLYSTTAYHYRDASFNQDNGKFLVCRWSTSGELLEFDISNPSSVTLRTVRAGFYGLNGVDVEPATGNFVVSLHYATGSLQVITPAGAVVKTISVPWGNDVKVEDSTGHYLYVTGTGSGAIDTIIEYDPSGTALQTYGPFKGYSFHGMDIYGSRQVMGFGPAVAGTAYNVSFSFPGAGNQLYVAALALTQRPGIQLGGSVLNLTPDQLFWLSVSGILVKGFQGVLDSQGRAMGSIQIPIGLPKGLTFYCSAVATNGVKFVTGNTIGITLR